MPLFVIHEHHARNLHFDFRLEMEGVLKSWAIPKGPSMDPKDKRLAIQVEDHEMSYADFEGEIPKGEYGAGMVYILDNGNYNLISGGIAEGRLEFELGGKIFKGIFALVKIKGKGKDWLLIKKKDGLEVEGFRMNTRD